MMHGILKRVEAVHRVMRIELSTASRGLEAIQVLSTTQGRSVESWSMVSVAAAAHMRQPPANSGTYLAFSVARQSQFLTSTALGGC